MANLNRIILVGRLTADPEARTTVDGLPVTKFRLAVDRPAAGGGSISDLFEVVAWRKLAEICGSYLRKGQLVLVEGRIQNRSFEDQTGQRRWVTEIVARNMQMLEKAYGQNLKKVMPEPEDEEILELDDSELMNDLPF